MMKVCCPNCGQAYTPDQLAELGSEISSLAPAGPGQSMQQEAAEYAPGGGGEPAGEAPDAEPKSMVEAMSRELDDPKKAKARAMRKE